MESLYIGNYKRWIYSQEIPADKQIAQELKVPERFVQLLFQRGLSSSEEIKRFLSPKITHLHNPFLMNGMENAVQRILKARDSNEKVLIYGDYDVDGVTATSILVRFLKKLGMDVSFYIPDRVDEGYGISEAAVDYIDENGFDLVITVDCGITARFQVEAIYEKSHAQNRTVDIIITDHHQYHEGLIPDALAIINPHTQDCQYPFKNLCGAGIALKLVQAIGITLGQPEAFMEYMDLAALATIADIVDLKDENRVIVKLGIEKMNASPCMGIKSLLRIANTSQNSEAIDSMKVSFLLAPRVNAAGRMGHAKRAVNLFTTDDEQETLEISEELNKTNTYRQEVQDEIYKQAVQIIEKDKAYQSDKVIVISGEGWHHGVIGIVASKLVDRYNKPAFVLSVEGDKAIGSGRSIEGFNLFECMEALSSLFVKFGGHAQAGGLTLMAEDVPYFRSRVNSYAELHMSDELLITTLKIDLQMQHEDINSRTAKLLSFLEPYGQANNTPVLSLRNVTVLEKKQIGNGKHLRLKLKLSNQTVDAIYFGKGDIEPYIQIGSQMDIVFCLELNLWQGREYLQLRLLDLRLEEPQIARNRFLMEAAKRFELLDCDYNWLYNGIIEKIVKKDDILVNRDDLIVIYRYIMKKEINSVKIADLFYYAEIIGQESARNINFYKLVLALLIFDELELLSFSLQADGSYSLTKNHEPQKVALEESELFSYLRSTIEPVDDRNITA